MSNLFHFLFVGIGGAMGSMARYSLSGFVGLRLGSHSEWGTLAVNVLGSFMIGFLAFLLTHVAKESLSAELRSFFIVGVCGGFTTFSAFSLEIFKLMDQQEWLRAGLYSAGSVFFCVLAVALGYYLAGCCFKQSFGI